MKKKYIFYTLAFLIFLAFYVRLNMYEYRKEEAVFYRINRITGSISVKVISATKWISLEIKSKPKEEISKEKQHVELKTSSRDSIDRELIDKDLEILKKDNSEVSKQKLRLKRR